MKTKKKTVFIGGLRTFPKPPQSVDPKGDNGILKFWDNFKPYKSRDDNEMFTREELREIKRLAEEKCEKYYKGLNTVRLADFYDGIYYKANKKLKEKGNENG